MLLFWRCMTFIGVCVEFVAAVAWLSELFPEPHRREAVLGYTQAFASVGGLFVAVVYKAFASGSPATCPTWLTLPHDARLARMPLISGLIPAIAADRDSALLARIAGMAGEAACGDAPAAAIRASYFSRCFAARRSSPRSCLPAPIGAAFGAIQMQSQIVPGLVYMNVQENKPGPGAAANLGTSSKPRPMSEVARR